MTDSPAFPMDLLCAARFSELAGDDAQRAFLLNFAGGGTPAAWAAFEAAATEVYRTKAGELALLRFADGSGYAAWREGTEKFLPPDLELAPADLSSLVRIR